MKIKSQLITHRLCGILLGALLTGGAVSAGAQIPYVTTVESTPNLLGYWRFTTDSQANSVVNGYTGSFLGNAILGPDGSGPTLYDDATNMAVLLDGANNSYVDTNLTGQIDQQGSIVGWFYLTALPSDAGHYFYIAGESQNGNDFDLQIETDNYIRFYTSGGTQVSSPNPLTAADLNTWHFIAATFTANGDRNLYLDGALIATNTAEGHAVNSATFSIGASDVFGGRFFTGALDEIALFNRDLTASEVSAIYNSAFEQNPPLTLDDSVSRVTHGSAGTFDIDLPQDGSGVECRDTGGNYTFVFTFSNEVVSGGVSLDAPAGGSISGEPIFAGNTMTVQLTGVTDVQHLNVTLSGVTDSYSQVLPDTVVPANILIGDVNGDFAVNRLDLRATRMHGRGEPITEDNFRFDLNADGAINRADGMIIFEYHGSRLAQ